jgi:sulfate adenylyltransferase
MRHARLPSAMRRKSHETSAETGPVWQAASNGIWSGGDMEIGATLLPARAPQLDLMGVPSWSPDIEQLDDLELLLSGALTPLRRYLDPEEAAAARRTGRLPDGQPAPLPLRLIVPESVATRLTDDAARLVLEDPEGLPLALLRVTGRWRQGGSDDGTWQLAGPVTALGPPAYGTFRRLRLTAAASRAGCRGGRAVLGVPLRFPLLHPDLKAVREEAARLDSDILLLPLVGTGSSELLGADALVRATIHSASALGAGARVVAVPLAAHGELAEPRRVALRLHVAAAFGATHVLVPQADGDGLAHLPGRPVVLRRPDYGSVGPDQLRAHLAAPGTAPPELVPDGVAVELARAHPPASRRGVTVLFTGLSGSGKSTVARGVYDTLLERGDRAVTLLDGDVVRRMLSAGLGFSRADRDLNVRRIGFVAAEISRHGGIALCAPIAPYASSRAAVRAMAEAAGEFVLVHVAAPLEVCEKRDRKGLYAKARAGLVPSFTGVSDPYEEPTDADLVLDTAALSPAEAVAAVVDLLAARGLVAAPGAVGA